MERLKERNDEAWNWITSLPIEKWSMSHDGGHRYGHANTNVAECVNSVLKDARRLPVAALIEHTFYNMVKYFDNRRNVYSDQMANDKVYTSQCLKLLDRCLKVAYTHHVTSFNREDGVFEVKTGYSR